jgi:hypothetical protein
MLGHRTGTSKAFMQAAVFFGIRHSAERLAGERRKADRKSANTKEARKKASVSKSFKVPYLVPQIREQVYIVF